MTTHDSRGRFAKGHPHILGSHKFPKGNIPWNKGVPCSEETKTKISEAKNGKPSWINGLTKDTDERVRRISEALKGKKKSSETRKKLSENHADVSGKNNPMYGTHRVGKANPMYGKTAWNKGKTGVYSEETLLKLSEWKKGSKNPMYNRPISEEHRNRLSIAQKNLWQTKEHRKKMLKRVFPKKDTSIEIAMQNELRRRGVPFEKHAVLLNKYQVDLLLGDLIVECDGDYWHSLPGRRELDRKRDTELDKGRYTILRFREYRINSNVVKCVDEVLEVIGLG